MKPNVPTWAKILTEARQAAVAAIGLIAMAVSIGILKEPWNTICGTIVFVASYYGVYKVPNKPASPVAPSIIENKTDETGHSVF